MNADHSTAQIYTGPATRQQLDKMKCANPACARTGHGHLVPHCCSEGGAWLLYYEDGVLFCCCAACGEGRFDVLVAERPPTETCVQQLLRATAGQTVEEDDGA